ncbi:gluconate 2-dehydrogenase subunit 3 family protein [Dyella acidiphila]|uniref:Gluconate 2-dehydrogenase subunit 3 family protein n=1 Tax=Dyella acidiphila TaxID=2775866 RepID=A0ABR9GBX7_9GAMM|nr:gluconate 2-dehydrogenase subunit 3 family protein [Dyella acidiphila]MBE1161552.1 gluconate 2-dehydrogenase subunit 3 family protein [Dyella acidiphila]
MKARYPGYNVLDKRGTVSWDDVTREVIKQRMAPPSESRFLDPLAWQTLQAVCESVMPQSPEAAQIPVAAMLDERLRTNAGDGYRDMRLPPLRQAWRIGLAALNEESIATFRQPYYSLAAPQRHLLLERMQRGELVHPAWHGLPSDIFFSNRVLKDICAIYYSHPYAWNQIGFGGPANPRGYVRMYFDRRDPWEAAEAKPGHEVRARRGKHRVR